MEGIWLDIGKNLIKKKEIPMYLSAYGHVVDKSGLKIIVSDNKVEYEVYPPIKEDIEKFEPGDFVKIYGIILNRDGNKITIKAKYLIKIKDKVNIRLLEDVIDILNIVSKKYGR